MTGYIVVAKADGTTLQGPCTIAGYEQWTQPLLYPTLSLRNEETPSRSNSLSTFNPVVSNIRLTYLLEPSIVQMFQCLVSGQNLGVVHIHELQSTGADAQVVREMRLENPYIVRWEILAQSVFSMEKSPDGVLVQIEIVADVVIQARTAIGQDHQSLGKTVFGFNSSTQTPLQDGGGGSATTVGSVGQATAGV